MKANHRWVLGGALDFLARGFLLLILLPIFGCQRGSEARRPGPPALDVNSTSLSRTRVVATLDVPLLPGTNLIWCASFQLAWKEFAKALKEEQPIVQGAEALCRQLNTATDPREFLPAESYYTASGWVTPEFVARIRGDMRRKFPSAPVFEFGPLPPGDLAAYAYLEASVPFAIPYFDSERPVAFREGNGNEVPVRTFGIHQEGLRRKPRSTPWRLMEQVEVLFGKNLMAHVEDSGEFAVDPFKQSTNVQLIVACVKPKDTLAATLQHVRNRAEATGKKAEERSTEASYFGAGDTLVIPEMDWRILHHLAELERRLLANSPITLAVQVIALRLDRHGVSLRSEAAIAMKSAAAGPPTHFEFTKPFLVLLKKRGAEQPFFVAWIDNAELLRRWE